jgi:hypothetical protein
MEMNQFDNWRSKYESMTLAEQAAYHDQLEAQYPDQAHYDYKSVSKAIKEAKPKTIVEAGAWKGDLCAQYFADNPESEVSWCAFELCPAAIAKAKTDKITYMDIPSFDWWRVTDFGNTDMFIGTHFIEHLSDDHFKELATALQNVKTIYFEAPIEPDGQTWEGYPGTHKLTMGWNQVFECFPNHNVNEITTQCKVLTLM